MSIKSVKLTGIEIPSKPSWVVPVIELESIRKMNIPFDPEDEDSILEAACMYAQRMWPCNVDYAEIDHINR